MQGYALYLKSRLSKSDFDKIMKFTAQQHALWLKTKLNESVLPKNGDIVFDYKNTKWGVAANNYYWEDLIKDLESENATQIYVALKVHILPLRHYVEQKDKGVQLSLL